MSNPFENLKEKETINLAPAVETLKELGLVYPALESAANFVTAPIGAVAGGLAGLGAVATNAVGLTDTNPSKVISDVASGLTYQPISKEGQNLTRTVNLPFEELSHLGGQAGDKVLELTGSPAAATVAETAVTLGPFAMLPVARRISKKPVVDIEQKVSIKQGEAGEFITPKKNLGEFERLPESRKFLDKDLDGVEIPDKAININFKNIQSAKDVKKAIYEVSEVYKPGINEARRNIVSHQETAMLADQLGLTVDKLLSRRKGEAFNAHEALAARRMLVDSAENLMTLKDKAKSGSYEDILAFERQWDLHRAIQEQVSGLTAEAGRALNQYKIKVKAEKERIKAIQTIIDTKGGREKITNIINMMDDIDTTQGLNKFISEASKATTSDMLLEAWINSLLSGPQTHAVNMTSNSLVSLWTIPEHFLASGVGKLHGGEKVYVRETLGRLYGLVEGGKEGLRAAAKTFLTGEPSDALTKIEVSRYKAIPGILGSIIRTPGRALMTEDEFFKAIGYRQEINSLAIREGLKGSLKGRALARKIEEIKRNPPEDLHLAATDVAHYQTFTKKLGEPGLAIQRFSNSHPSAKLIIPFVRTPINILKFAGERSPLAFFSKSVREELKAGGTRRDLALSRIIFGSTIGTVFATLAAEGKVTGGGPSNPDARQLFYASGRIPYAIKIGNKWHSFSRLEPLGMILGISADFSEISGQVDKKNAEEIAGLIVTSISKNLISKTWLKGASNLVEALQDPDRYGAKWLQNYAGTLIPTGAAQVARVNDPVLRRTDDIISKIKSRIPGYSRDLPPRLNIWGEPIILEGGLGPDIISPVYLSYQRNDKTTEEMLRLNLTMSKPDKKIGGIELTPELHNEKIKIVGKNVKVVLDKFVNSKGYDDLPDGIKALVIKRAIQKTRKAANGVFFAKHPEILVGKTLKEVENLTEK